MDRIAISLAAAALSATFAVAAAQADDDRASSEVMGEQAISQITTYAGYDVVEIDLDGDVYRVKAFEPAGRQVELLYLAEDASLISIRDGRSKGRSHAARE